MLNRVILGAAIVLALTSSASPALAADSRYLAVIDAGSSGTRLTLYGDDGSLVPTLVTVAATNTDGLSSFAANPDQAGPAAVTPLLEQLDAYLAAQGIAKSDVPVSLLATAGMREVRRYDRAAAQAILNSTGASIAASGHPLEDNRILPAVQEATLAWLDTNVLAGTLDSNKGGLSILEIGGASAQVAFRSPVAAGPAVHQVRFDGRIIPVVAVSYLGLGGNDARTLMQADYDAGSFCFPNNVSGTNPDVYVSDSARPVDASSARYSWIRCASAYDNVIASTGATRTAAAPVPPSGLRDLPGFDTADFIGLGGLQYTYDALGIDDATNKKIALRGATTGTCTGDDAWSKVLARYAGRSSTFADTLCSNGTYAYELVFGTSGVGVSHRQFTVDDTALPRSPAWTSGYAITVLDR